MNQLQPAVAKSVAAWHKMMAEKNLSGLPELVNPDAVFRSPMVYKPYESAQAVVLILNTAFSVFENFTYHREFASDDGLSVTLEFSANVGDKQLKGIDMMQFDADGKIVEFEVMIRPMSGLQALAQEIGARLAHLLPAFKQA